MCLFGLHRRLSLDSYDGSSHEVSDLACDSVWVFDLLQLGGPFALGVDYDVAEAKDASCDSLVYFEIGET